MAYDFLLSSRTLSNGKVAHYAKLAGSGEPEFKFGYRTMYEDNYGLFNLGENNEILYDPRDYSDEHDFWAYFIYPTAKAESKGSFCCLNTYDRARFTFGFMQYAAHVPNGDFVKYFRLLMDLPNARDYFPRVVKQNGFLFYSNNSGSFFQMEDDMSTEKLMNYLNPSLSEVENQELICSARMVHWAKNDPEHRKLQVTTAIDHFKNNMISYDKRFKLHNVPAKVCLLICDIRHQGRGNNDMIGAAINTGGNWDRAYSNLLLIGNNKYKSRIDTVRNTVSGLLSQGIIDKRYDSQSNSFL